MATATRLKLTPADHGREIDPEEFEQSTGDPDYHFEIIDGRVYVSPVADLPHDDVEDWLYIKLKDYSRAHPDVINYVSTAPRVFIHSRPKATCPEPDIAAYSDYPHHLPRRQRRWQDISPVIVVEVVSEDKPEKDLVRNVALYLEVPSIKEYWVLDPRPDPDRPSLRVYRRRGANWQKPIDVPYGETYQTPRVLPGFTLVVDPDQ
jgi:Uma2 family endonuclease